MSNFITVGEYLYKKADTLDEFTQAYIEAALWTSTAYGDDEDGMEDIPMDDLYDISDISPECLQKMIADCAQFQEDNWDDINDPELDFLSTNDEMAGHDFWLTRNEHGSGFWDGDWPEPQASRLTEAAQVYGEFYLDAPASGEGPVSC